MKLLRNEADYFAWMRLSLEDDATNGELRVYGPTAYPCYAYWQDVPEDAPDLLFLYESDIDVMLQRLRRATPAQETV